MLRCALPLPYPTISMWPSGASLGFFINLKDLRAGRWGAPGEPKHRPWGAEASTPLSAITPEPSAWTSSHVHPQIQIQESLGLQESQGPTWGSRNSYLTVQRDTDQLNVAIEIHMLLDGSIVRGRDQESLWGQEWAKTCHPVAGMPRCPGPWPHASPSLQ